MPFLCEISGGEMWISLWTAQFALDGDDARPAMSRYLPLEICMQLVYCSHRAISIPDSIPKPDLRCGISNGVIKFNQFCMTSF